MGTFADHLAKRIRSIRGDIPQMHFCKKLGISNTSLHRIEMAQQNVTIETLEAICRRLKCTPDSLLLDEKTGEPAPGKRSAPNRR